MLGSSCKESYRPVITREVVLPPVCYNFFNRAVCLSAGWEWKGLLMEIHSELIAGHYTTIGRDQKKELNGWRRRVLVKHEHTQSVRLTLSSEDTASTDASTHSPTHISILNTQHKLRQCFARTHTHLAERSTHSTLLRCVFFMIILSWQSLFKTPLESKGRQSS